MTVTQPCPSPHLCQNHVIPTLDTSDLKGFVRRLPQVKGAEEGLCWRPPAGRVCRWGPYAVPTLPLGEPQHPAMPASGGRGQVAFQAFGWETQAVSACLGAVAQSQQP